MAMKKILISLFLLTTLIAANYSQYCRRPVPQDIYRQKYLQLSKIPQEGTRLTIAMDFTSDNCLSSQQAKEITMLFRSEQNKLDFARNVYCNITDKSNFYVVYDAFSSYSAVFRLHDFVAEEEAQERGNDYSERSDRRHQFPTYNYPSWQNFKDNARCRYPISDDEFYNYVDEILRQYGDNNRYAKATQIIQNQCLSVEQIMKIASLLDAEQTRLQYLEDAYQYSYDYNNYGNCSQLFTNQEYRNNFNDYYSRQGQGRPANSNNPGNQEGHTYSNNPGNYQGNVNPGTQVTYGSCRVSQDEMNSIIKSINDQTFTSSKVSVAKQIIQAKRCFTSQQIKTLVDLMTFEDSKLDLAKYCYDYCIDRDNYYLINSSLTMSSDVEELSSYIRGKR
jgi:hypothetical protein